MNKLWFLRRLDLFAGMSDAEMRQLGALLSMRSCRTGQEIVVRPPGDRVYLVKSGRVRVSNGGVNVAILGPGQLFGTSALFGAAVTTQRVTALDDVLICEAPAAKFLAAMATHPRLAAKIMSILARELFDLEDTLARTATEPVESRLADLILRLADRSVEPSQVHGLSQADIARMIGASRESVSRALASWERAGVVRCHQRMIDLVDEDALRAHATAT